MPAGGGRADKVAFPVAVGGTRHPGGTARRLMRRDRVGGRARFGDRTDGRAGPVTPSSCAGLLCPADAVPMPRQRQTSDPAYHALGDYGGAYDALGIMAAYWVCEAEEVRVADTARFSKCAEVVRDAASCARGKLVL